jgi:hypothetical protein
MIRRLEYMENMEGIEDWELNPPISPFMNPNSAIG